MHSLPPQSLGVYYSLGVCVAGIQPGASASEPTGGPPLHPLLPPHPLPPTHSLGVPSHPVI